MDSSCGNKALTSEDHNCLKEITAVYYIYSKHTKACNFNDLKALKFHSKKNCISAVFQNTAGNGLQV